MVASSLYPLHWNGNNTISLAAYGGSYLTESPKAIWPQACCKGSGPPPHRQTISVLTMKTIRCESFQRKRITAIQVSFEWKVSLSIQQVHAFCFLLDVLCQRKIIYLKFMCTCHISQISLFFSFRANIRLCFSWGSCIKLCRFYCKWYLSNIFICVCVCISNR